MDSPATPPPHTPYTEYSPHKRARIITGYDVGLTTSALAAKEGIPKGSISGIVKRYKRQRGGKSLARSGRPRKLSDRDIRAIQRTIANNPFISLDKIRETASLEVSTRTISRELIRRGIMYFKALRRPKLSAKHARKRLTFALAYINQPLS